MVRVSPVLLTMSVGGISVTVPAEVVVPRPAPTWPVALGGSRLPYM